MSRNKRPPDATPNLSKLVAGRIEGSFAYSGPLPPPEVLARFDRVVPGLAERIVGLTERQFNHRQAIEAKVIDSGIEATRRGQRYAFLLSLLVFSAGVFMIYRGHDTRGFATLVLAVAGLATVFVAGRRKYGGELSEKRRDLGRG